MMQRSTCKACGRLNPQMATGSAPPIVDPTDRFREVQVRTPFTYPQKQYYCVSCRHAPTLPGRLAYRNLRRVG